jgi:hypothetical protein
VTSAASERLAERVGPGEHGRTACEQHEGTAASPKCSTPGVTPPGVRNEWTVECIVNLQDRCVTAAHATRETSPAASAPAPTQGFAIGTTTVFRYIREALDVLAALAPTLRDAVTVCCCFIGISSKASTVWRSS